MAKTFDRVVHYYEESLLIKSITVFTTVLLGMLLGKHCHPSGFSDSNLYHKALQVRKTIKTVFIVQILLSVTHSLMFNKTMFHAHLFKKAIVWYEAWYEQWNTGLKKLASSSINDNVILQSNFIINTSKI